SQIMIFDIIFSLDSILTAIGLTRHFFVMAVAIIIAIFIMIFASEGIHHFIEKYPTIKMLALSFLLLIGVMLICDGFGLHIPREYIYFAIAFSIVVEFLNQLARRKRRKS
ncbi:MAG: TerC family protein, partial [Pseudomonadota bacterium]